MLGYIGVLHTRAISLWKLKKKLSGCASNSRAHEDLGQLEEAHHCNIQAKFYNEKFPLVYESDNIGHSLYEKHGATLKHKCGKG